MRIWSLCFAYVLFFNASMAQGESRRALEMAECGYLVGLAAEQLHASSETSEALDQVIDDVVDFANLYYHLSGLERPVAAPKLSLAMYQRIMKVGREVFDRRTVGISAKTSNKLASNVMATCREDLRLLGLKLRHG